MFLIFFCVYYIYYAKLNILQGFLADIFFNAAHLEKSNILQTVWFNLQNHMKQKSLPSNMKSSKL